MSAVGNTQVSQFHTKHHLPFVCLPGMGLVYRSLLSSYASPITRCAAALAQYKAEFNKLKEPPVVPLPFPYDNHCHLSGDGFVLYFLIFSCVQDVLE